jgi:hypothetical protein
MANRRERGEGKVLTALVRARTALALLGAAGAVWLLLGLTGAGPSIGSVAGSLLVVGVGVAVARYLGSAAAARRVPVALAVRSDGRVVEVEAPTPFWCAVDVPRRPARPRAPGKR